MSYNQDGLRSRPHLKEITMKLTSKQQSFIKEVNVALPVYSPFPTDDSDHSICNKALKFNIPAEVTASIISKKRAGASREDVRIELALNRLMYFKV